MKQFSNKMLWSASSIVLLFLIWYIVSLMVPDIILPSPIKVLGSLVDLTITGELPQAVYVTLSPLFIAFALAVVFGAVFGIILGVSKKLSKLFDPWIYIFWATPDIALLPLIIVWFGIGTKAQIVFVFMAAVFPVIMNAKTGARNVESNLIEVAKSLGSTRWELIKEVVIPSAVPHIMAGIRIAVGRCTVAVIISQLFVSSQGIGYMLQFFGDTLQLAKYFAPLIVVAIIGIALNSLADYLEKRILKWKTDSF